MGIIQSLTSVLGNSEDVRVSSVYLQDMDREGSPVGGTLRKFLFFPETISDHKSSEWLAKSIVGASHPIYQWMTSGARSFSFEVVFARDSSPPQYQPSSILSDLESLGSTTSNISKNPLQTALSYLQKTDEEVDISAACAWLRSKTYPTYSKQGVAYAPPKMYLQIENSGILSGVGGTNVANNLSKGPYNSGDMPDTLPVVMTSCNITYDAFFRNGSMRIVTVQLEFVEIVQIGTQNWSFVDRSYFDTYAQNYTLGNGDS